jgi:hypothetical protein
LVATNAAGLIAASFVDGLWLGGFFFGLGRSAPEKPKTKNQKHQAQDTATMRHAMPTPGTDKAVDLQRGKELPFLIKKCL